MKKTSRCFQFILLMVLPLMMVGCATNRHNSDLTGVPPAPQPPSLLSATAKLIDRYPTGFTASLEMEISENDAPKTGLRGKLYSDGTNFLFRPDNWQQQKNLQGGFSFLWSAKSEKGFILCELLQGYAPMDAGPLMSAKDSPPENVTTNVAASNNYTISQHGDSFLVQASDKNSHSTLRLTSVIGQRQSSELFQPPPGFTFYSSRPEMMYEFSVRNGSGFGKKRSLNLPDAGEVVTAVGSVIVAAGYLFVLLLAHSAQ